MFMTRSLNVTPNTTEQHLIARSDKSVACVTNNKRLQCAPRFVLLKPTTDRHEASRGLFATAELLVKSPVNASRLLVERANLLHLSWCRPGSVSREKGQCISLRRRPRLTPVIMYKTCYRSCWRIIMI